VTISLTIPRKELIEALKRLRKHAKKKGAGEAILSYESGMLTIQISGVVARAEPLKTWDWVFSRTITPSHDYREGFIGPLETRSSCLSPRTGCRSERCQSPASGKKKLPPGSFCR
jgi:hypothetical protein